MVDILDLADRLWRGVATVNTHHPLSGGGDIAEVADGVAYVASFARVSAFKTGDGLVLVDTGHALAAGAIKEQIRSWAPAASGPRNPGSHSAGGSHSGGSHSGGSDGSHSAGGSYSGGGNRLNTAIFSHGHVDHVFGVGVFEAESEAAGWPAPVVVAHEAMPARFDRYILTAGYNAVINQRQFQLPELSWPTEYRYPDRTYRDELDLDVGGRRFELHHARGETDDHTWTYVPDAKVLCTGDLFIWASPNAGNPQKVQRYPREWAAALRQMAGLGAETLLPGHGWPVAGAERVRQALEETAELLESIVTQTLDLMNAGARLNDVIHSVAMPAHLLERPYLRPVYDDPEFIVRNLWRQFGGWYDGDPSTLKPAPAAALASELAALAGGAHKLADRASQRLAAGTDADLRLAGHLAELAAQAAPADPAVQAVRAAVFRARAEAEPSTMAKGIFAWAEAESRRTAPATPVA